MKKLLLDTSVIIDFLRRKDKTGALLYQLATEDLYISIITHTELYSGKSVWENKKAQEEVEELFSGMTILPLIIEVSQIAGKIKAYGPNISMLDCIIAATARYHDLDLVTLNIKDFIKISGIKLFAKQFEN